MIVAWMLACCTWSSQGDTVAWLSMLYSTLIAGLLRASGERDRSLRRKASASARVENAK